MNAPNEKLPVLGSAQLNELEQVLETEVFTGRNYSEGGGYDVDAGVVIAAVRRMLLGSGKAHIIRNGSENVEVVFGKYGDACAKLDQLRSSSTRKTQIDSWSIETIKSNKE